MVINKLPFGFFWHTLKLRRKAPFVESAPTTELVAPFRYGRSIIFRVWPGQGLVFGRWKGTHNDEQTALMQAVYGRTETVLDDEGRLKERYRARRAVASRSRDLDDEWQILDALDLMEQ